MGWDEKWIISTFHGNSPADISLLEAVLPQAILTGTMVECLDIPMCDPPAMDAAPGYGNQKSV